MLIRKTQQPSTYPENQIHDAYSTSATDTYSCNYINGIVERGSNSLGSFVKFGDGTLICMGNPSGNSNNSDWWSFCNRTDEGIQVNFPYAFIEPPESVVCSPANYYGLFSIMLAEINKDNFKFTGLRAKNNSGTGWAFRYQAIGKWK